MLVPSKYILLIYMYILFQVRLSVTVIPCLTLDPVVGRNVAK